MSRHWLGLLVALAAVGGWSGGLHAQAIAIDGDTVEVIPIAPVSVTVLRTPLQMDEVPYSVSVNTKQEIQRGKPGLSVEEGLRLIPGVQVENRHNYALGERIAIRGFGARAQFGVRGVRMLIDGIPATLPDGQSSVTHVDVKSVGRVEVIRGPAAALYGNTAGGVIQMEMETPPMVPFSQEFGVVAGSHGLLRLQSSTAGQSAGTDYQVNLTRLESDGYRQHSEARNLYLNSRIGWSGARDRVRVIVNAADSDALNPGSLSAQQQADNRWGAFPFNVAQRTGKTVTEGMAGLSWMRQAEPGEFEMAGYVATRDVVNPIPSDIIDLDRTGGGIRALFSSAAVGPLGLRFAAGAEADRQNDHRREYGNAGGERDGLTMDQDERVDNLGFFGQVTARPAERLTLLGALRYDRFDFTATDYFINENDPDDSGSRKMDAISPSFGATVALTDDVQIYGNVGTTFETPTTVELGNRPDGAGGLNPDLEPQTALSFELGGRALLAQRVALQLAVYRADVENSLIPFEIPGVAGRTYFRNAGSATHQGVEVGATLAPVEGVSIQTAYTYTDATFDDYIVGDVSHAGNRVPGVAPHRFEGALTLSPRPGRWYLGLEGRHQSEVAVTDGNTEFSPSYTLAEARAGLSGVRLGNLTFDPFVGVTNLFDVDYNTAVTVNAFGSRFYEAGPGRSFYVGGTMRFDGR